MADPMALSWPYRYRPAPDTLVAVVRPEKQISLLKIPRRKRRVRGDVRGDVVDSVYKTQSYSQLGETKIIIGVGKMKRYRMHVNIFEN